MLNLIKKAYFHYGVVFVFAHLGFCTAAIQPNNSWHYEIAPYGWMSSIKGNVMVKGFTTNIHFPFSEILKHLDFAAQGHFEAGRGPWTLMLDPTYLKVSDNHQLLSIGLKIISKTVLVDAGLFYRLYAKSIANGAFISLELLGGARHLGIGNTLEFNQSLTLSNSTQMNAPIVGGRFKGSISPRSSFWLRGDIGGFHVDHVNQTWSTTVGLTYAVKKNIDLGIAYKALKIDYNKNTASMSVLMQGPALGISFHD